MQNAKSCLPPICERTIPPLNRQPIKMGLNILYLQVKTISIYFLLKFQVWCMGLHEEPSFAGEQRKAIHACLWCGAAMEVHWLGAVTKEEEYGMGAMGTECMPLSFYNSQSLL